MASCSSPDLRNAGTAEDENGNGSGDITRRQYFDSNPNRFLARFFPKLPMPGTDVFSSFDEAFEDVRWAQAGKDDPFVQEAFVTPPLLDMAVSTLTVSETNNQSMGQVEVPILVLVGASDVRINIPEKLVENARHQLFQDQRAVTKDVLVDIQDWDPGAINVDGE